MKRNRWQALEQHLQGKFPSLTITVKNRLGGRGFVIWIEEDNADVKAVQTVANDFLDQQGFGGADFGKPVRR